MKGKESLGPFFPHILLKDAGVDFGQVYQYKPVKDIREPPVQVETEELSAQFQILFQ